LRSGVTSLARRGQAHGVGAAVGRVWLADDQTVALELVEKGNQARLVIFDRLSER